MRLCSHCGGDGYLVYVGGPGYFSPSFGNWLPGEREEQCSFCGGTGWRRWRVRKRLKFSRVEASYPEAAANHGWLEVGVIFPDRERHRAVPVAVGGQATQIRKHPPGEEGFLALVGLDASAEMVSPRGKPAAGVARPALPQGWLLLWEVLGEDPRDFPLGKAEARRQAIHRIRRDILSRPFARERGKKTLRKSRLGATTCHRENAKTR